MEHDLTVCGGGPIMPIVYYLNSEINDLKISILRKGHSGEIHASESVVDYISVLFHD